MTDSQPTDTVEVSPRRSLVSGASWLLAAKTVAFVITTALPFILSRRLSQTEFGYYKQLFLMLASATTLLPLGMHMSLFYFMPRAKSTLEKGHFVFGVVIFCLFTSGLAGGSLILFPGILQSLFHSPPLTASARQIGIIVIPYVVSALLEYVLVADGETRLSAITIVSINTVRTLFIIIAAVFWGNIRAIVWSLAFFLIFQTAWLSIYLLRRFGTFWKGFRWDFFKAQLSYGMPLGFAGLLWSIQLDIHSYFVSHYFNAALFAVYANGCFQLPLVGILGDSVGSVLIPRISSLQASGSTAEIVSVTVKAMRGLAFVYAPLFFFMSVSANQLITLIFTKLYLASVPIFRVNLFMVLLAIVAVDPVLRAYKSERYWMLRLNAVLFVVLVAALFLGVTRFGLVGAISAVVILQYAARILTVWHMWQVIGVRWVDVPQIKDIGKTLLAALFAGLCILPLLGILDRWGALVSLAGSGVVFGAAYLTGLLILKIPSEDEVSWFLARSRELLRIRS